MSLSIRTRLTTWYAGLLAAVIVGLGAFLVLQLDRDLRQAVDADLLAGSRAMVLDAADLDETEASDVDGDEADAGEAEAVSLRDLTEEVAEMTRDMLPASSAAQVLDGQGRVLVRYGAVAGGDPMVPPSVRAAGLHSPTTVTTRLGPDRDRHRVHVSAFPHGDRTTVLVLAVSLEGVEDAVRRVLVLLVVAGPAALAGTALAAWWLARQALRPVERMTSDAQEIGTDRLHERVAVPATDDEVGRLAVTLNDMLERIERGVLARRRLVADASHELRTPLAVMRAEIDVGLLREELSPGARDVLHSAVDEVDRMTRTVDNLLTLAEVEERRLELLTSRVDLSQVVAQAARPLETLASAKGVTLLLDGGPWAVQADPRRLRLALTTLVENAVKFTPAGGVVRVLGWQCGDEVGVTVVDDGPGVPPADREQVFDRFYRVGSGHSGSGLGLSICREVVLAHGGRVWVDSEVGQGSAFTLALPSWRTLGPEDEPTEAADAPAAPDAPGASAAAASH